MRARPESSKREPFSTGRVIPYAERFSPSEYTRLQEGLIPRAMEDKWFVYFDEPHLFLHRRWSGRPVYRVKLSADAEGVCVTEALCVFDVSPWLETTGAAYQSQLLDFLIGNLLLGKAKPFPLPPGYVEPVKGALQRKIFGTGYPQTPSKLRD